MHLRAHRRLTLLPLAVAGVLLLAGCSEWGPAQPPRAGGTMRVSATALPTTWDPDSAGDGPEAQPIRDVEAPLLQLTPHTQQPTAGLARSWKYDASRTQLTVALRPSAEFSNGHHVRPKDVVFSVHQWIAGPDHGAFYSGLISDVAAHGAHSVVFSLNAPSSAMVDALTLTSSAIVPDGFGGRSADAFYARPVGAGPFEIHHASAGAIDLTPNKHFYDTSHPYLSHLDYRTVSDPDTAMREVHAGRTDLAEDVPAGDLTTATGHPRVVSGPSQSTSMLTFSPSSPLAKGARLRKGVSLAIDRASLVSTVYDGQATVAGALLPVTGPTSAGCPSCTWSQQDVSAARSDLAPIGHHPLSLLVDSAEPTDVHTAQVITPMLTQAGLTVRTVPVDAATMQRRLASGDYDLALQTLSSQTPSAADPLQSLVAGHYLVGASAAAAATQALRAVDAATDSADSTAAVAVFEQHSFDTDAAVPLVDPNVVDVVAAKVRGLSLLPSGLYHASGLWLKK